MEEKVIPVLIGMMLVTYLPRMLPLVTLSRVNIPPLFIRWLHYIPAVVLSSLLAPELLLDGTKINISFDNVFLLASIPSFLIAVKTKNLFLTVFTGMLAVVILMNLL